MRKRRGSKRRSLVSTLPDEKILELCEEYIGLGDDVVKRLAARIEERWRRDGTLSPTQRISRQFVHEMVREARRRNLLLVAPAACDALRSALCDRFGHDRAGIHVAATDSEQIEHVAIEAARVLLGLVFELGRKRRGRPDEKDRVHIGFGAGWSVRRVAYHLSRLLPGAIEVPPLTLHAISSGFACDQPLTAPVVFFGFFEGVAPRMRYVGLFGPAVVPWSEYDHVRRRQGTREAFAFRHQIDIVVTSLASARDDHGDLRRFLDRAAREKLARAGIRGDVQHQPFSSTAPITEPIGNRAVTLFDLRDLARLARTEDRYVVLVSPPCGICHRSRADALVPLLRSPELKVWSHLVTDIPTARAVLELA
jgi:DNA-binding transcriptional regulator LsrR (DeoR family)